MLLHLEAAAARSGATIDYPEPTRSPLQVRAIPCMLKRHPFATGVLPCWPNGQAQAVSALFPVEEEEKGVKKEIETLCRVPDA